jgi:hypothetical protein
MMIEARTEQIGVIRRIRVIRAPVLTERRKTKRHRPHT